MLIAVRVDSSTAIGLGHIQRCLALARALVDAGGRVVFVTRSLGSDGPERIERTGFRVHRLPAPGTGRVTDSTPVHAAWAGVPWSQDAAQTVEALREQPPDRLVVDHYAFDARWHSEVARALACPVAVIDDLADRPLMCDLLIDHNVSDDHRQKYADCFSAPITLLGGPRFALLGATYADAPRYAVACSVRSIGIFMGGSDAANLSVQALRGCREFAHFDGPIEIVTTSANPHLAELKSEVGRYDAAKLSVDLPELSAFFARHDLQIGAGGGASWERCCIGAPTLAIVAAPNQKVVIDGLTARGAVATIGGEALPSAENIGRAVRSLTVNAEQRRELAENARRLVDGRGAMRVALAILAPALKLRRATVDDSDLVFRWRNDPSVRGVSRNSGFIDRRTHDRWIAEVIKDVRRHLFIAHIGARPVGVLRLDDDETARSTEVSLYVGPDLHGLGLGRTLLRAAESACRSRPPGWRLTAIVLTENRKSRRLFERAGYRFDGERGQKLLHASSQEVRSS
jgi:UDP-2,4-diacetamido-2,4,6-trideoxy-beta-L-altropyranose hydrolase